jgi:NAD(P)-dependent dehydrogenase (short-subunit alcohol dehydrogenase family)
VLARNFGARGITVNAIQPGPEGEPVECRRDRSGGWTAIMVLTCSTSAGAKEPHAEQSRPESSWSFQPPQVHLAALHRMTSAAGVGRTVGPKDDARLSLLVGPLHGLATRK